MDYVLLANYERNEVDLQASLCLGMGTSRVEERICCAFGLLKEAPLKFESCQTVPFGGGDALASLFSRMWFI